MYPILMRVTIYIYIYIVRHITSETRSKKKSDVLRFRLLEQSLVLLSFSVDQSRVVVK